MREYLGSFVNESGIFIVSDPCYELSTWCQGRLTDVATGKWAAFVKKADKKEWGIRCVELLAKHESVEHKITNWELCSFLVGVDSGQAGIFDEKYYANNDAFSSKEIPESNYGNTKLYNFCCDITLSEKKAGVLPYGTVSSSGFGDGTFQCYISKNNDGKIIAIKIIFI